MSNTAPVFLDTCATTPTDPRVRTAMAEAADNLLGNPSSVHAPGRRARGRLTQSRTSIANLLEVAPAEIVFVASGSEANNLAIKGPALHAFPAPFRIVVSAFEHDSVLLAIRFLTDKFEHVQSIEVRPGSDGIIDPADIDRACAGGADLVCVMAVNNEIGSIQRIAEIGEVARKHDALFLVDAVQGLGRLDVLPNLWNCDLVSASSHKIYGPKGMGFLYARSRIRMDALVHGGHQERGLRAGTESSEGIVGMAKATELAYEERDDRARHLRDLEEAFLSCLRAEAAPFDLNGSQTDKVPGVVNLSMPGVSSSDLVIGMDLEGFAISAGAACSSGVIEASHVLQSMALEPWRVRSGVRISFGKDTSEGDAIGAAKAMARIHSRFQANSSGVTHAAG